jgi:hypothetical protein
MHTAPQKGIAKSGAFILKRRFNENNFTRNWQPTKRLPGKYTKTR